MYRRVSRIRDATMICLSYANYIPEGNFTLEALGAIGRGAVHCTRPSLPAIFKAHDGICITSMR
jgi:hypothetical protein